MSVQALAPLAEVLPHHLIQNLDYLCIGVKHLLAAVCLWHEVGLLKHLGGSKGNGEEVHEGTVGNQEHYLFTVNVCLKSNQG